MPQIKANMKSMRQDAAKRAANAAVKSQIHGAMKKAVAAATSENKDEAFRAAVSIIDRKLTRKRWKKRLNKTFQRNCNDFIAAVLFLCQKGGNKVSNCGLSSC